ncbi:MAG: hypothetical protein WAU39_13175 [Polyangiales bacterium]
MRGDRTKHERNRNRNRDLDWFAEDPWSEPELASLEDSQPGWEPDLWGTNDEELDEGLDLGDALEDWDEEEERETINGDDYDGWGPVRRRTKQRRED